MKSADRNDLAVPVMKLLRRQRGERFGAYVVGGASVLLLLVMGSTLGAQATAVTVAALVAVNL